jgi:hypothetical protein
MPGGFMFRKILAVLLGLLWAHSAAAHLMPAQHGTLNVVGSGGFMVLSLPVSALTGVDANNNGSLEASELQAAGDAIEQQVLAGVQLRDEQGLRPVEGLLYSLSPDSDEPGALVPQLVVMGRFALEGAQGPLRFKLQLYGKAGNEQRTELTVTQGKQRSLLLLDAVHDERPVFATRWQVFVDALGLGVRHILSGPDHLLFLLVVLFGTVGWRQVLAVLTTFTVGHAITLVIGSLGLLVLPDLLVESAIAATIVIMALLEWLLRRRGQRLRWPARLVLVLACALIHGLGFAAALRELGLIGERLWPTIAGFNVGIELGQLLVALPVVALLQWWRRRAPTA